MCAKSPYFAELLGSAAELTYFSSGEDFLKVWQPNSFELIVLDIFMDKLTQQVRKAAKLFIIFLWIINICSFVFTDLIITPNHKKIYH